MLRLNKKELVEQGEKVVKTKMKPRGGNSPVIGDNGVHTKPGDNSKIAGFLLEVGRWPAPDKSNAQELEDRFWRYVDLCNERDVRVTNQVAYFAMGISKDDVYNWENGLTRSSEHRELIKKVKAFCGSYREMLGADGRLNPVTLVWWQKNYDGLVDKSEWCSPPTIRWGLSQTKSSLKSGSPGLLWWRSDDYGNEYRLCQRL